MTRTELAQIYYLDKDLRRCQSVLEELRATVQAKSQQISGMSFANTGETSDPTESAAEKLLYYEWLLEGYMQGIAIRKAEITQWINELDDPLLRQIVHFRCIELRRWEDVAAHIGASASGESCKKYYYRNIPR